MPLAYSPERRGPLSPSQFFLLILALFVVALFLQIPHDVPSELVFGQGLALGGILFALSYFWRK
jgi:hypothetical protein